jgi:hypothetical protein
MMVNVCAGQFVTLPGRLPQRRTTADAVCLMTRLAAFTVYLSHARSPLTSLTLTLAGAICAPRYRFLFTFAEYSCKNVCNLRYGKTVSQTSVAHRGR